MRYEFILQHSSEWEVTLQCRVLEVSRNGYYAWLHGIAGKRKKEDLEWMPLILKIHEETGHTYGAEWIAKEVNKRGRRVGKERMRRLMRAMDVKVQCKNAWMVMGMTNSSKTYQPSPDLVKRKFYREELDSLWLSDFSEFPSLGNKIYVVAMQRNVDLCTVRCTANTKAPRVQSQKAYHISFRSRMSVQRKEFQATVEEAWA